MELDANEEAAKKDHETAVHQMDWTEPQWQKPKKGKRVRGEPTGVAIMDQIQNVKNDVGKREVTDVDAAEPPPAKCLQLPPAVKKPEEFDIAKTDKDEVTKATVNAKVPE